MDMLNYYGPAATALWNIYGARASKPTYDFDESAAAHSPEASLSRFLRPGLPFLDFSGRVAYALGKLALDPEAPNVLDTGLEELAGLIDVLSRSSISVFTSALFDFILAEAEEVAQEWRDDGLRRGCILHLAQILDDLFTASGLLGSGYAQRAVEVARHAALKKTPW